VHLSVLDLVPVREGQTSAQALAASLRLAALADRLGFTRYWFAEHHNMPAIASTTPPVLIAAAAMRTTRIRLGSGGVMLPNHVPFIVAEQFAALEALAPGRIDLAIGRAPGSDPVITQVLRAGGMYGNVEQFPDHVRDVAALMRPGGALLRLGATGGPDLAEGPSRPRDYAIAATPAATGTPDVWLLGSSDYSAHLAARLGLPYAFAYHFAGDGLEEALSIYRGGYEPSPEHPEPQTLLPVNVVVDEDADRARTLALPWARSFARVRAGRPLTAVETVETATAAAPDPVLDRASSQTLARWVVGTPDEAAERIGELGATYNLDEVMLVPVGGAHADDPADRVPSREHTVELLAGRLR